MLFGSAQCSVFDETVQGLRAQLSSRLRPALWAGRGEQGAPFLWV